MEKHLKIGEVATLTGLRRSARRERKPPWLEPEYRDPGCRCKASDRGRKRVARPLATSGPTQNGRTQGA